MKLCLALSLVCVLACSCGPGGPINPSGTAGGGGETGTAGATAVGSGKAGGALPSELPPMWSDNEVCSGVNGTGDVAAIGPALPEEAGAWALVCMPTPTGGLLHGLRIYPAQGGQCVPLAGEVLLFSAPDGEPTATPANARSVPLPVPEIPAGEQYVRQTVDLTSEPFEASPGMLCVGLRLVAEGEQSVCYVQGLNCGTSWLSTTENPYAWTTQNHIPIVGINID